MADATIFVKVGQILSVVGVPADAPVPPIVVAPSGRRLADRARLGWQSAGWWRLPRSGRSGRSRLFAACGRTPGPKPPNWSPDPSRASDRQSVAALCGRRTATAAAADRSATTAAKSG